MKTTGLIRKNDLIRHIKDGISAKRAGAREVTQDDQDFLTQVEAHPNSQVHIELDDATKDITILG
jgi:hypothetical protein